MTIIRRIRQTIMLRKNSQPGNTRRIRLTLLVIVVIALGSLINVLKLHKVVRAPLSHNDHGSKSDLTFENLDDWIVLLTTCVTRNNITETQRYEKMYTDSILKWFSNTSFPIVIVENSGKGFSNLQLPGGQNLTTSDRIDIVISNTTIPGVTRSSSVLEAESLNAAMDYINNHPKGKYDDVKYILKVTGRYFLSGIEETLKQMPMDADFYLQKHRNVRIDWQNSEYFGVRKELISNITSTVLTNKKKLFENALYNVSSRSAYEIFYKGFPNKVARGGDKLVINPLRA
jgi:hypothetical protein